MGSERTIASAIEFVEHLAVFDDIMRDRFAALDTTAILVHMIDTVPESALLWLARGFGVMGNEGWRFATTTEQRRELVKTAIELHRFKGTPYGVKSAIERGSEIEYGDIDLVEGLALRPLWTLDGSHFLNGSSYLGDTAHWADFAVVINQTNGPVLASSMYGLLIALIEEYKAARCRLVHLAMGVFLEDDVTADDDDFGLVPALTLADDVGFYPFLDGTWNLDGSAQLDTDHLQLTII